MSHAAPMLFAQVDGAAVAAEHAARVADVRDHERVTGPVEYGDECRRPALVAVRRQLAAKIAVDLRRDGGHGVARGGGEARMLHEFEVHGVLEYA